MKRILFVFILAISLNVQSQTLSEIAREVDKVCPMKQGFMDIKACRFSQNTFVFDINIDAGKQFNIQYFKNKPTEGKEWFKIWLMFGHKNTPYLCNRVIQKNVNIKFNINDLSHNVSHIVVLTPKEIQNAINRYAKLSDSELSLTSQVVSSNIQTPLVVDRMTTMSGVVLTPEALQFEYVIDDSQIEMTKLKEHLNTNRTDILHQYTSSYAFKSIINALIRSNRSLILLYKGRISKSSYSITFNKRELSYKIIYY